MASYELLPPRMRLNDDIAAALRDRVAEVPSIVAVWWLTAVLRGDDGSELVREELHFELEAPPEDKDFQSGGLMDLYHHLAPAVMPPPGISWCISPIAILADVRAVGSRIV